jgi:ribonucleoside-diphosphate reductase alpha chain
VLEAVTKMKADLGPARKRMPAERQSITHKFSIAGHEGYITAACTRTAPSARSS